jgi:hypothetical protein
MKPAVTINRVKVQAVVRTLRRCSVTATSSLESRHQRHFVMQLVLALVVPVVLLMGFTALLATGRLSISRNAAWLLERQGSIWMAEIVARAAAAAVVALQR